MPETVTIDAIGHRGDGLARSASGTLYVPFTLPGERVSVEPNGDRARLIEVLEPSLDRVPPPCRHFGVCGGCAFQMMPLSESRALKRSFVVEALAQAGVDAHVDQTIGFDAATRRRIVMTGLNAGGRILIGYNERLSNRVIDVEECPILVPTLQTRLPALRRLIGSLVPRRGALRATVLLTAAGLDISVENGSAPSPRELPQLVDLAESVGLSRLTIDREIVLSLAEPLLDIAGTPVVPPPGGFVQASAEAEQAMTRIAAAHLAGSRRIADLFAGIGTFSLALAREAPVHAVEGDAAALDSLAAASRRGKGLKPITTERRDLFRFPLSGKELDSFDGLIFDPPRAGAKAQAEALAVSRVRHVVAVSCNPATFGRDARILLDGGYKLERVNPVDQFVYAAATEVVGLFRRD